MCLKLAGTVLVPRGWVHVTESAMAFPIALKPFLPIKSEFERVRRVAIRPVVKRVAGKQRPPKTFGGNGEKNYTMAKPSFGE